MAARNTKSYCLRWVLTTLVFYLTIKTTIPQNATISPTNRKLYKNVRDGDFALSVQDHDLTVLINEKEEFGIFSIWEPKEDYSIVLVEQYDGLVRLLPQTFNWDKTKTEQIITVLGLKPGRLEITANSTPDVSSVVADLFVRVTIANSQPLILVSLFFGWIYFVAWSVSFYPQIYINYRRKSVVGLNFDFVTLNIVGFTLYSVFNCCLFWIPEIQNQYYSRYPRGLNPVMLNDVVFSLHAMFATIFTIIQCIIYEKGGQRVSRVALGILGLFFIFIIISLILAAVDVILWLDFLYYCSYVKLAITIIKYVPQALMNYRRKSTVGWSIGNILLDFTGGMLSMLQMILNAYNYDDWVSIFGDPTKFGLGLFSVLFDIFFILQHYVFYRNNQPYDTLAGQNISSNTEENNSSNSSNPNSAVNRRSPVAI